ncbi:hypothetical protein [Streptomyces sp. MST-110588]|uniref:hypothetical protein n=1 Tax=Streptomyces sp. MST-110588 TaxID=2833628 RepID=UPI001F5DA0B4|nr:hypothetical protein [Streptomyces sp. MST-110588]UNO38673.1 hypothetical protein KGS77_02190 [Streptomyces sp. MST-110588]
MPFTTIAGIAVLGAVAVGLSPLYTDLTISLAGRGVVLCGTLAAWMAWLDKRSRLPTAEQVRAVDERPPVVFLRTFGKESVSFSRKELPAGLNRGQRITRRFFEDKYEGVQTIEFFLADEIDRRLGPLTALGDPTDRLPRVGAVRNWVQDDEWQTQITDLIAQARCLLAVIHASPGLEWELKHVRDTGRQQRLFLCTPPHGPDGRASLAVSLNNWARRQRPEEWADACAFMSRLGYTLPTAHPGPGAVIGFGPGGEAIVLTTGATTAAAYVTAVAEALEAEGA